MKFRGLASVAGRAQTALEVWLARIAAGIILAMMLLTTADVVGRYVFNSPVLGAYEVSEFMLVAIVFLSIAYVQSVKGHILVDFVASSLPRRTQIGLDIFGYILGLFICLLMTWHSAVYALKAWDTGARTAGVIEFRLWPAMSLVPFGMALLCLRFASDIWHDFANWLALRRQSSTQDQEGS